MRLKRYITESPRTKEQVAKFLMSKCSKAIMAYREGRLLYRGTGDWKEKDLLQQFKMQKDRQPRDTNIEIHKWLNKLFTKSVGWPVRNGISVTPDHAQADEYGWVQIFFPMNGFKYAYHPDVYDMWNVLPGYQGLGHMTFDEFINYVETDEIPPDLEADLEGSNGDYIRQALESKKEEWEDLIYDLLNFRTEKDESLADSIVYAQGEMMFNSPTYYLLNPNHDDAGMVMENLGIPLSEIKSASGNPIFEPASSWR